MKIIKNGRPKKEKAVKCTCTGKGNGGGGCGAVLLVEQRDVYVTAVHSYDGSSDTFTTFTCPCCGVETDTTKLTATISKTDWKKKNEKPNLDD